MNPEHIQKSLYRAQMIAEMNNISVSKEEIISDLMIEIVKLKTENLELKIKLDGFN